MSDVVIGIRLTADSQGLVGEVRMSKAELDKLTGATRDVSSASKDAEGSVKGLTGAFGGLKQILATLGIAALMREFISLADTNTQLNNSLRLVTSGEQELIETRRTLFELSQRTAASTQSTIQLYSRLSRATEDLNYNQEDLLRVTETVNKAIALSGVSAASAEASLIQLSQGLASGTLRGDELNSVLEQTPALARAIADGMGVTIGQLRALGAEGEITAQTVVDSLLKMSGEVDQQFSSVILTVSQSWILVKNAVLEAVGSFDQATGISQTFAKALQSIAQAMSNISVEDIQGLIDTLVGLAEAAALVAAAHYLGPLLASLASGAVAAASAFTGLNAALVAAAIQMRIVSGLAAGLRSIFAFLGGPAGLIVLAAGGIALWAANTRDASVATSNYSARLKELQGNLAGVRAETLKTELAKVTAELQNMEAQLKDISFWDVLSGDTEDRTRLRVNIGDARRLISALKQEVIEAEKAAKDFKAGAKGAAEEAGKLGAAAGPTKEQIKALAAAEKEAAKEAAAVAKATAEAAREWETLVDSLLPAEKAAREMRDALEQINEQFVLGNIDGPRYIALLEALGARMEGIKDKTDKATEGTQQMAAQASPFAEAWGQALSRIDDAFEQLWSSAFSGFEDFAKALKAAFLQLLAQLAHAAITRPILLQLGMGGLLGGGYGGVANAAGMSMGQGGLSNLFGMGPTSLLGGSGISSGLNTVAAGFGFGPTGIPNAATGLDAAPLFGGSNLGFGLAGLAGGFIGSQFGGYGGIGGSLGGMAGFGLTAAGSALSATAIGASMGSIFPIVGTLAGAVIGGLIGSLFGKKGDKSPDLQVTPTTEGFGDWEIRQTKSGGTNIQKWITESPFGNLNWRTKHDAFGSEEDAQQFAAFLTGVSQIEQRISDLVGPEMTDAIAEAMNNAMGDAMKKLAEEGDEFETGLNDFLKQRFGVIFDVIGGSMERVYESILSQGETAVIAAEATVNLFQALENLTNAEEIYQEAVEAAGRTMIENAGLQVEAVQRMINQYDGSLEATQELTLGLQALAEAEVALLAQLDSVREGINASVAGNVRDLTLERMGSDEERYNYLRQEIIGLTAQLNTATSAEEVARLYSEIEQLTNQAIGLLSDEQLKGEMGQEIIDFWNNLGTLANERLDYIQETITSTVESVLDHAAAKLDSFASAIVPAANTMASAAASMAAAGGMFANAASMLAAGSNTSSSGRTVSLADLGLSG